ncbi:hypothetical protein [Pseudoalteromonas sp. A601]|uniref:hypothetical protein n=1 Tax=Pseudoalteromonas sp. A601 TaxID=1967839 RepID=UPI0015937FE9|nr:hypothetical protein [Pseudoalteromonas sp. A601]
MTQKAITAINGSLVLAKDTLSLSNNAGAVMHDIQTGAKEIVLTISQVGFMHG